MKSVAISGSSDVNATAVTNEFIDRFMPSANGEFVKVYLFLLRHKSDPVSFSTSDIADRLNHTENDVLRALRYWETQNLLALTYDHEGELIGITLGSRAETLKALPDTAKGVGRHDGPVRKSDDKELKSLLYVAEQYLGKTLSKTEADTIAYFLDGLDMSADLVEYLIETCVENGHKRMSYIQKVALSWQNDNITTLEQAKQRSLSYNKNCFTVLNAFGIKNRGPATSEAAFIRRWTDEMGFSPELIREACDRTIMAAHAPSFEYADTILEKWKKNNVHTLGDLQALDEAYVKEKASQGRQGRKGRKPSQRTKPSLQQRSYDMDSLEDKLLKNN